MTRVRLDMYLVGRDGVITTGERWLSHPVTIQKIERSIAQWYTRHPAVTKQVHHVRVGRDSGIVALTPYVRYTLTTVSC